MQGGLEDILPQAVQTNIRATTARCPCFLWERCAWPLLWPPSSGSERINNHEPLELELREDGQRRQ